MNANGPLYKHSIYCISSVIGERLGYTFFCKKMKRACWAIKVTKGLLTKLSTRDGEWLQITPEANTQTDKHWKKQSPPIWPSCIYAPSLTPFILLNAYSTTLPNHARFSATLERGVKKEYIYMYKGASN